MNIPKHKVFKQQSLMGKKDALKQADFLKILSSSLSFQPDPSCLNNLQDSILLIKTGGNALTNAGVTENIVDQIASLKLAGAKPVVVHGGGIAIKQLLNELGIESEFVGGHRKTDSVSMRYIEMALSGHVNKELVKLLNEKGVKAVGISGKDAAMVTARKRIHVQNTGPYEEHLDLGHVGDVQSADPSLVQCLLAADYIPVVSPVSAGDDGKDYNINADMFAGHLAGALGAQKFIALTDIDGLLGDIERPGSILHQLSAEKARGLFGTVIQGGMIPKAEACLIALEKNVSSAHIINGTKKETLLRSLMTNEETGTTFSE